MKAFHVLAAILNLSLICHSTAESFGYELILATLDQQQNVLTNMNASISRLGAGSYYSEGLASCPDSSIYASGLYLLKPKYSTISTFPVYCDYSVDDGRWIVIHRRYNGALDFNRTWVDYRNGFGNILEEYWLGLERMHQITRSGKYELLVVMKNFNGSEKWAKYERFSVASEFEQFKLVVGKFVNGTAGDSFEGQNNMKFSTPDRDNDRDAANCAATFHSGWWFSKCFYSNLNGLHRNTSNIKSIWWNTFNNIQEGLKEARMMIRNTKLV